MQVNKSRARYIMKSQQGCINTAHSLAPPDLGFEYGFRRVWNLDRQFGRFRRVGRVEI